ncbi:hypothetical protein GN958_ATG13094 [Phytophthora infestans]|uniref:Uncharacterized protein n=1 Tax=Phytophthora infestans TaxID=4787 RepID=A0A8S9UB34_PHYIN|nr:hypothetical protein GN958_ATG13094 [Phytophthora infestans]
MGGNSRKCAKGNLAGLQMVLITLDDGCSDSSDADEDEGPRCGGVLDFGEYTVHESNKHLKMVTVAL